MDTPCCSNQSEMKNEGAGRNVEDKIESNMEANNYIFKHLQSRSNFTVPINVQDNLIQLVSEYKEGIWCAKIPDAYKERYKETLNYSDYGYKSLVHLCVDLGGCLKFMRPGKGDYKIYHKSVPMKFYTRENIESNVIMEDEDITVTSEEALPDITDLLEEYFLSKCPKDIVKYGEVLAKEDILNLPISKYFQVRVSEIYDPSKFWIILNNPDCLDALEKLTDDMQLFYVHDNCPIPQCFVKVGMYCVAFIYSQYHRARIVSLVHNSCENVKLYFFDYGSVATIPSKDLHFLRQEFFKLPEQAIRARLYGIYPLQTDTQWLISTSERFTEMVTQKDFFAQICAIDIKRNALELILGDTTTDVDIFINDALVNEGRAIYTNQKQTVIEPEIKPIVKYIHLFPTFDEIELGMVPSGLEMPLLKNIAFHMLYPRYYKINYEYVDNEINNGHYEIRDPRGILNNTSKNCLNTKETSGVPEGTLIEIDDNQDQLAVQSSNNINSIPTTIPDNEHVKQHHYMNQPSSAPLPAIHLNPQFAQFFPNYYQPYYYYMPYVDHSSPTLVQNNEFNNLLESFNQFNINSNIQAANDIENKFVSIHVFYDDILHLIRYKNNKYFLLDEVANKLICMECRDKEYVNVVILNAWTNRELRMEMLRLKLLDERKITIHLVLATDVSKFIKASNKRFEYEKFLLLTN